MVQVLPANTKGWDRIMDSFSKFGDTAASAYRQSQAKTKEVEALNKLNIDPSVANLPPEAKAAYFKNVFENETLGKKKEAEREKNQKLIQGVEKKFGLEQGALDDFIDNPAMAVSVTKANQPKANKNSISTEEVPPIIAKTIKKIIADNPNATSDELLLEMDEAGIPRGYSNQYTENRRRSDESISKTTEERKKALRAETLPIRQKLAEKSSFAQKGIQNKEQLLDLIKKGDINDPTFATLAQSLPLNLGKRLLSSDTIEYKGGLVDEFGDLRNIFQGQTRVKEIELLEEKIADLYLTDDQKEAVLKSRINALKADIIRAETAAELEDEDLGVLQFEKELDKRVKPKLEALFNQILDEQQAIFKNAENRKAQPLDPRDPDDMKIMQQIKKEAKGDKEKAKQIAKKKGYTW